MTGTTRICLRCCEPAGPTTVCRHCGGNPATTDADDALWLPAGTQVGRYFIGRVLGQGGFGITYLARDLTLDTRVAIKEYMPRDAASRSRDGRTVVSRPAEVFIKGLHGFLDEARALAKLRDAPSVVTIHDVVEANGTGYMVMEYLDGWTLADLLGHHGGRLRWSQTAPIAVAVLDGLRAAHAAGLIHRDVKPSNVVVTREEQVKLLDFGAARQLTGYETRSVSAVVTDGFAPPEQYDPRTVQDARTDVYGAGATFWTMLTGSPPPPSLGRGDDDHTTALRVAAPDVPPHAAQAIDRALRVRPADRFASAREFQVALGGEAPKPDSRVVVTDGERERKDSRRRAALWIGAGAVAAAGLLVIGALLLGDGLWPAGWGSEPQVVEGVDKGPVPEKETPRTVQLVKSYIPAGHDMVVAVDLKGLLTTDAWTALGLEIEKFIEDDEDVQRMFRETGITLSTFTGFAMGLTFGSEGLTGDYRNGVLVLEGSWDARRLRTFLVDSNGGGLSEEVRHGVPTLVNASSDTGLAMPDGALIFGNPIASMDSAVRVKTGGAASITDDLGLRTIRDHVDETATAWVAIAIRQGSLGDVPEPLSNATHAAASLDLRTGLKLRLALRMGTAEDAALVESQLHQALGLAASMAADVPRIGGELSAMLTGARISSRGRVFLTEVSATPEQTRALLREASRSMN
ncbi:MAG: hypothetical protein AMXMBFR64_23870 [Myxococcales bacterium]